MRYFLAIDAGGTKTECVLGDERRELARVQAGSIKRMRVGEQEARRNLTEALDALSRRSGVGLGSISASCVGTSGASVPMVADFIREALATMVAGEVDLCGDEEIAMDAAFEGERGVLVIAGTGSHVAGRAADGRMARAGGWGPTISDEGSGHWIGQQAVCGAFRAINAGKPTALIEHIQRHWQLGSLADLVAYANAAPDFASLAPVVAACADAGDPVACDVLRRAGEELAQLGLHVIDHVRELESPLDQKARIPLPEIAVTGSVLRQVALVRQAMEETFLRAHSALTIRPGAIDPVDGALWRARKLASSR